MVRRIEVLLVMLALLVLPVACAPAAVPTATPVAKAPTAAPAKSAEPAKPALAPPAFTPTPRPASIKLGGVASSGLGALYLSMEKGYFKEQGIDAENIDFQNIQEIIAPLGTGQLDVGVPSLSTPLLAAADRGIDLKVVAPTSVTAPKFENSWIMLRKDLKQSGQVKTASDLKGMTIAILSQGGFADQTVQLMLEQAGLQAGEVEVVVLPPTNYITAFANKAIAAGFSVEPYTARILQEDLAVKWMPASSFYGGQAQIGVVVFGGAMLKDQDLARRWMVAYLKGTRDYMKALTTKQGWDDLVKAVSKYTPIKDSKTYELIEFPYVDPNGSLDKKSIDIQYKWWVGKGLYKGQKTFDMITDLSHAEYAAQRLGRQ